MKYLKGSIDNSQFKSSRQARVLQINSKLMKVMFFGVHELERKHFEEREDCSFEIVLTPWTLSVDTVSMAEGFDAVSIFIYDDVNEHVLSSLKQMGIELIIIRASGTDHVDMHTAERLEIEVRNIPDYGAESVAEHTLMLMLAMARKVKPAIMNAVKHHFSLHHMEGKTLSKKTIGIIGTGKIGLSFINLLKGFEANVIAFDVNQDYNLAKLFKFKYVGLDALLENADLISLHLPLNTQTKYMINAASLLKMKNEAILVNTSRGAIVNTYDLIHALDKGIISGYATDVYENEKGIFHREDTVATDKYLQKLIQHEKVLLTPHLGFATENAIRSIAFQTLYQLEQWYLQKEAIEMA